MSDLANTATVNRYLKRFRANDRQTWKRFVACYVPFVYDICRSNGCSAEMAQQLTEETLRDVCHEIKSHRLDSSDRPMRIWLETIVTHRLSESGVTGIVRDQPASGPANGATQTMAMPQLRRSSPARALGIIAHGALKAIEAEFPPREFEAFRRAVVDREPAQKIADEFGESVSWVFKTRYRLLVRLRQVLQEG